MQIEKLVSLINANCWYRVYYISQLLILAILPKGFQLLNRSSITFTYALKFVILRKQY